MGGRCYATKSIYLVDLLCCKVNRYTCSTNLEVSLAVLLEYRLTKFQTRNARVLMIFDSVLNLMMEEMKRP